MFGRHWPREALHGVPAQAEHSTQERSPNICMFPMLPGSNYVFVFFFLFKMSRSWSRYHGGTCWQSLLCKLIQYKGSIRKYKEADFRGSNGQKHSLLINDHRTACVALWLREWVRLVGDVMAVVVLPCVQTQQCPSECNRGCENHFHNGRISCRSQSHVNLQGKLSLVGRKWGFHRRLGNFHKELVVLSM